MNASTDAQKQELSNHELSTQEPSNQKLPNQEHSPSPQPATAKEHKIYSYPFSGIYQAYLAKVERKGRSQEELDQVLTWFSGQSIQELHASAAGEQTLREYFEAVAVVPAAEEIRGTVCGVSIASIEEPLMKKIRQMDKLVDELARGKAIAKIIRAS